MQKPKILVFDTETTDLDTKKAEIIELGALSGSFSEWEIVIDQLYKPTTPVSVMTSSVTDITNNMLTECVGFHESDVIARTQQIMNEHEICVAHNLFYDGSVMKHNGISVPNGLCTVRMARRLFPGLENYKLSYLRYYFDLPVEKFWGDEPVRWHRALADASVTALLFDHLLDEAIERGEINSEQPIASQLIQWMEESSAVYDTMPFGKYRGKRMTEVPLEYWQWALENMRILQKNLPDYDKDFAASVEAALNTILNDQEIEQFD